MGEALLHAVGDLARQAGDDVMRIYAGGDPDTRIKGDGTPATAADERAERIILAGLKHLAPDIPVISEEETSIRGADTMADTVMPKIGAGPFWLVDPLDGTREFLARNGEFTINIALIDRHRPVLGVVFAPALDRLFLGRAGQGAWCVSGRDGDTETQGLQVRAPPVAGIVPVASRRHGDADAMQRYLAQATGEYTVAATAYAGSSLKFCLIAAGSADIYPRFGRTMEWDTAAGHAVLEAAGGYVGRLDGTPLTYAKNAIFENPPFIAWGGFRPTRES